MRKELKKALVDNPTPSSIENVFQNFGFKVKKKTIKFVLSQKSSIEEKVFNLIEGCL